ncbi:hypothetical protein ACVWXQ_003074 [Bradyrhizobium sp. S3.14.4]
MLDFPNAPVLNQKYPQPPVAGVPVYTWDGEKWTTKADALGTSYGRKKNYILNGAMGVNQRNPGIAVTANAAHIVDQFFISTVTDGTMSWQQVASPTPSGSPNRIRGTVTVADAALGTNQYMQVLAPSSKAAAWPICSSAAPPPSNSFCNSASGYRLAPSASPL